MKKRMISLLTLLLLLGSLSMAVSADDCDLIVETEVIPGGTLGFTVSAVGGF